MGLTEEEQAMRHRTRRSVAAGLAAVALIAAGCTQGAQKPASDFKEADGKAAAQRWVSQEFTPSTLSKEQQLAEMDWFIKAAAPYRGMQINVVSETITTHEYESRQLAKAFTEITGIKIKHDLIQERSSPRSRATRTSTTPTSTTPTSSAPTRAATTWCRCRTTWPARAGTSPRPPST
jgi:ABC-type glycerol-3-phosphate transport system substrate-binding protein